MPAVSIVVPVYNTAAYVDECIRSLVNQTEGDIEIMCVDDGSTDGSGDKLDEYAAHDARIKVVHQQNGGVSRARNVGLEAASGDYVMFVDSDDYLALGACEKLLRIARTNQADIVVFGGSTFPSVAWIDGCLRPRNMVSHDPFDALLEQPGSFPLMCNKLYDRSLIERVGLRFNENLKLGEDNAFQFCIFPHASCVAFSQDELYFYRCEREGSAVKTLYADIQKKVRMHLEVVRYVLDQWDAQGILEAYRPRMAQWASEFLADDAKDLSFNDRCAFAEEFSAVCQAHGISCGMVHNERVHGATTLEFLLDATRTVAEAPQLALLAVAEPGCTDLDTKFVRLASQLEQRLQILCVDAGCSAEERALLQQAVAADDRATLLDAPFEQAVHQALSQVQAPYVAFANINDRVDAFMAGHVVFAMEREPADVCTYRDHFHSLRLMDVGRMLIAFETTGEPAPVSTTGVVPPFAPKHCPDRLYGYCSLSYRNKVFSRDLIERSGITGIDECSIARALDASNSIVALGEHYVFVEQVEQASPDDACAAMDAIAASYESLATHLQSTGLWDVRQRTWANALLSSLHGRLEMYAGPAADAAHDRFGAIAARLLPASTCDAGCFYERQDFEDMQDICSKPARSFFEQRDARRLAQAKYYAQDLEGVRMALDGQRAHLEAELADFETSISYRVGRAITAPLRVIARRGR